MDFLESGVDSDKEGVCLWGQRNVITLDLLCCSSFGKLEIVCFKVCGASLGCHLHRKKIGLMKELFHSLRLCDYLSKRQRLNLRSSPLAGFERTHAHRRHCGDQGGPGGREVAKGREEIRSNGENTTK